MQKSTGKELAIRKTAVSALLKELNEHHRNCESARGAVIKAKELSMFHAWRAGICLNKIKEIIGHGNFISWLEGNFRGSRRTAEIYMRIDNQNLQMRDLKNPNAQHVAHLAFDTIRKYAIGFVPEKDQPEHKGNIKFGRSVSFLNIANESDRLEYRHTSGLQLVDFDEAREETQRLVRKLMFIHQTKCPHCDALIVESDPWVVSSPAHAAVGA